MIPKDLLDSSESSSVWIGSDHAGFELKEFLKKELPQFSFKDVGTQSLDSVDYPDFAARLAKELSDNPFSSGILICGSGQGMAISANRYRHLRAALCHSVEMAELARGHNGANVLCMGSRFVSPEESLKIVNSFFKTPFEGGRHERRVLKINSNN